MIELKWVRGEVPKEIKVKQVYAVAFDDYGRVFLREYNGVYHLTGGKPEAFDNTRIDTLKREFLEEANITLKNIHMLGYQLVIGDGDNPYAQIRMVAQIDKVFENRPDTDNGLLYQRFLTTPPKAKEYLNWDDAGRQMLDDATALAYSTFNFDKIVEDEKYF